MAKAKGFGREKRYGNGNGYDNDKYRPTLRLDMRTMSNLRSNQPTDAYREGWDIAFGKRPASEARDQTQGSAERSGD